MSEGPKDDDADHPPIVSGSPPNRPAFVPASSRVRSQVTNSRWWLPGGDNKGAWARRFRDVMALHVADLGGDDNISEAEHSLVRRCAALTIELERMESRMSVDPEPVDFEKYQRMVNTLRRTLESLGLQRRMRDVTPAEELRRHLATKIDGDA